MILSEKGHLAYAIQYVMNMKIDKKVSGITEIFYLRGELTISTSDEFRAFFLDITVGEGNRVLLNLAEMKYLDSMGMAAIIDLMKNFRDRGISLALCDIQPNVMSILKITRFDKVMTIFLSEGEAVKGEW